MESKEINTQNETERNNQNLENFLIENNSNRLNFENIMKSEPIFIDRNNKKETNFPQNKRLIFKSDQNKSIVLHEEFTQKKKNSSDLLDLDLLLDNATPPSELLSGEKLEKIITFRKSKRIKKSSLKYLICHQCKKTESSSLMLICTSENCQEAYCMQCLKKYYPRGEINSESIKQKIKEQKNSWICYLCKDMCICKYCSENMKEKLGLTEKKNNQNSKKKLEESQKLENNCNQENDERLRKSIDIVKTSKIEEKPIIYCKVCNENGKDPKKLLSFDKIEEFFIFTRNYFNEKAGNETNEFLLNKEELNSFILNNKKLSKNDEKFPNKSVICLRCFESTLQQKNGFSILLSIIQFNNDSLNKNENNDLNLQVKKLFKTLENTPISIGSKLPGYELKEKLQETNKSSVNTYPTNHDLIKENLQKNFGIEANSQFKNVNDISTILNLISFDPNKINKPNELTNNLQSLISGNFIQNQDLQKNQNIIGTMNNQQQFINNNSDNNYISGQDLGLNLEIVSNNIGKLVEIISQFNQKHLTQNSSMLTNINNMINILKLTIPNDSNNEIFGKSMGNICNLNLDPLQNSNNLSSFLINNLDEIKKQIYSLQYYSLVQKLFISYIFKNLEIFTENIPSGNINKNSINGNHVQNPLNSLKNQNDNRENIIQAQEHILPNKPDPQNDQNKIFSNILNQFPQIGSLNLFQANNLSFQNQNHNNFNQPNHSHNLNLTNILNNMNPILQNNQTNPEVNQFNEIKNQNNLNNLNYDSFVKQQNLLNNPALENLSKFLNSNNKPQQTQNFQNLPNLANFDQYNMMNSNQNLNNQIRNPNLINNSNPLLSQLGNLLNGEGNQNQILSLLMNNLNQLDKK